MPVGTAQWPDSQVEAPAAGGFDDAIPLRVPTLNAPATPFKISVRSIVSDPKRTIIMKIENVQWNNVAVYLI